MAIGIGTVEVKMSRGTLVVLGLGKTPRGTKFIRDTEALSVKSPADPKFKAELGQAIAKMFAERPVTG